MNKRRILGSERGFTLVELGIVMAIIAILAAVAYPTYKGMTERAKLSEAKTLLQEIRVIVWANHVEKGGWTYPDATELPVSDNWDFDVATATSGYEYAFKAFKKGDAGKTAVVTMHLNGDGQSTFTTP